VCVGGGLGLLVQEAVILDRASRSWSTFADLIFDVEIGHGQRCSSHSKMLPPPAVVLEMDDAVNTVNWLGERAQMGHATAEAIVRAGLNLVPVSFTGESEGVAVDNVGVSGVPVELILPEERQQAMDRVKAAHPGLVIIDFTLPTSVNGAATQEIAAGACESLLLHMPAAAWLAHSAAVFIPGGLQHAAAYCRQC